jgi:GNAT superfamily N-acetyltransferase
VHLDRFASPAAFLAAAEPFLLEADAENALILGVAHALAAAPAAPTHAPWFAVVRDDDGEIIIAAFSSLPERAAVTRATGPGALPLLADALIHDCPTVTSINGPEPTVGELAAELGYQTALHWRRKTAMRIHQLDAVAPLDRVSPGILRLGREDDLPVLSEWVAGFMRDTGEPGDPSAHAAERVRAAQLFVWDDGGPVSMLAWSGKTPNGIRVNLVYTPDALRGKGYATTAVAALSQRLLDEGNRFCCLYTDLANPVSNAIYARIGYQAVCDAAVYGVEA